jgi:hypothetical protein
MTTFWDFEGKHAGETVWVLGSGKTLDFVPADFFADKTVVATNKTFENRVRTGYVCTNYWLYTELTNLPTIMPEDRQVPESVPMEKNDVHNAVYVPTIEQKYEGFVPANDWPEYGRFVVGPTSLHLSLHWAVWLGAAHIVLVGADCGVIDGENNVAGYYPEDKMRDLVPHAHHRLWEKTLVQMAEKIRSLGVSVHSLNPWVTFNLEGHTWTQER